MRNDRGLPRAAKWFLHWFQNLQALSNVACPCSCSELVLYEWASDTCQF